MRILTRNIAIREEQNWLETLKNAISDPKILLKTLNLPVDDFAEDIAARKLFAMRVPLPFVEKMEKGNPKDPLFLQVMTAQQEFIETEGFSQDPLDEQQKNAVPNILHKYQNRLLFMAKGGCAVNCRYCFRRHFPYDQNPGNKPNFKRVSVKIIGESASRRLQLSRGDIDIADALPVDQLNALKQENKVNVAEYPSLRVTYLYLNNSKAPLNQADLRRAISWSTDYQGMVNGILSGNGKQMRGPIPEGMWGYDATAMQYNHDETKAKAEWDKVTSKPTSLTFLYSDNDPNWEPIALATQSSLNKLGINVKLEKLANATMRDRVGKGDYDIAIGNWSPDFADPYMFMNYWFESDKKGLPGNRSFYENSEVDKLLRNALATTDQTQRTRDYQQAQKIVIDDAAYVYLFQKNYQLAMNKEVKGFVFNPMLEQVFNINTMSK